MLGPSTNEWHAVTAQYSHTNALATFPFYHDLKRPHFPQNIYIVQDGCPCTGTIFLAHRSFLVCTVCLCTASCPRRPRSSSIQMVSCFLRRRLPIHVNEKTYFFFSLPAQPLPPFVTPLDHEASSKLHALVHQATTFFVLHLTLINNSANTAPACVLFLIFVFQKGLLVVLTLILLLFCSLALLRSFFYLSCFTVRRKQ